LKGPHLGGGLSHVQEQFAGGHAAVRRPR
jgi:hypothetical protein